MSLLLRGAGAWISYVSLSSLASKLAEPGQVLSPSKPQFPQLGKGKDFDFSLGCFAQNADFLVPTVYQQNRPPLVLGVRWRGGKEAGQGGGWASYHPV